MCDWIAPVARDPLDGRALAACSESRRRDDGATFFLCALHGAVKSRVWLHEARMRAAYPEAYRRAVFGHYDARWRGVKPRLPAVGEEEYHLMQRASPKIAPKAARAALEALAPAWAALEAPAALALEAPAALEAPPPAPDPLEEVRAMLDGIAGVEGLELLDWASIVADAAAPADADDDALARPALALARPIGPVRRTRSALR
jgi:hypothetical protein